LTVQPSRVGVVLDCFGPDVREALAAAGRLAFGRAELPVAGGQADPARLSHTGRRHLARVARTHGVELAALGADLGGLRFADSADVERCLDKTRQVIEMAAELRIPVVTSHLGRLDETTVRRAHTRQVLEELADAADRTGTFVAFETAGGEPRQLAGMLREIGCPWLAACYDPASLIIEGFDPLAGMEPLADRIVSARGRDALSGSAGRAGREVPLGEGHLDLPAYLAALDQAGYRDAPFLRRTEALDPQAELAAAKSRLERLLTRG